MTKIMLVEDDKSLREIYGVRLLAEGYDITSAGDGEEALAMAVKEKPDLILSDVMMPKISGFDMLDILRSTPETKDIKVIMMTALSSEDQRDRGEKLGANRYLVKSQVGIEDVVRTVHDLLADTPNATPAVPNFGIPEPTAAIRPELVVEEPVAPELAMQPEAVQPVVMQTEPTVAAGEPTPQPEVVVPAPVEPNFVRSPEFNPSPVMPQPAFSPGENIVPEPAEPVAPIPAPTFANFPQTPEPTPVMPITPAPIAPVELPRPTAPFSTPAPASLGDRVINPITPVGPQVDISSMMDQELNGGPVPPIQTPPTPPQV